MRDEFAVTWAWHWIATGNAGGFKSSVLLPAPYQVFTAATRMLAITAPRGEARSHQETNIS
jgi:hypothetical protein